MRTPLRNPWWIRLFFLLGLVLGGIMVLRSQVAGDQLELLTPGWLFAVEGEWVPLGVKTSAGGKHPGGLLSLLVGAPLVVWRHHLAPTILVFLSHIVAYMMLDRLVRTTLGPEARLLFAIFYWLNPWRILHSGFLWNPNYFFLFGAIHLSTAYGLRERGRFGLSFLHVVALGLALQINLSALSLLLTSGLLWWKGYIRVRWSGVASGGLLVLLTLLPWLSAVLADPALLPRGEGFPGRGLVTVYPVVQGILTWLRYPAIAVSRSMACVDFSEFGGPSQARMQPVLAAFRLALIVLTLPIAAWANWFVWRRRLRFWRVRYQPQAGGAGLVQGRRPAVAGGHPPELRAVADQHLELVPAAAVPHGNPAGSSGGQCATEQPLVGRRPASVRIDGRAVSSPVLGRCCGHATIPLRRADLRHPLGDDAKATLRPPHVRRPGDPRYLPTGGE